MSNIPNLADWGWQPAQHFGAIPQGWQPTRLNVPSKVRYYGLSAFGSVGAAAEAALNALGPFAGPFGLARKSLFDPKTFGYSTVDGVWFASFAADPDGITRRSALWAHAVPATTKSPASGTQGASPYAATTHVAAGTQAIPSFTQAKNGGWTDDTGIVAQPVAPPSGDLPGGVPGIALPLTVWTRQDTAFVPAGNLLIDPWWGGPATDKFGTVVSDVTAGGDLDVNRRARIQSAWRTYRLPVRGVVPFGAPAPRATDKLPSGIAWQLALDVGAQAGWGVVAEAPDDAAPTPPPPTTGGTQTRPGTPSPPGGTPGTQAKPPTGPTGPQALAAMGRGAGGPVNAGGATCPHVLAVTPDGENVYSAHHDEKSLIRGATGDAPFAFDPTPWKKLDPPGPFTLEVWCRNDVASKHDWVGGVKPGLRRWQTTGYFDRPPPPVTYSRPTNEPTSNGDDERTTDPQAEGGVSRPGTYADTMPGDEGTTTGRSTPTTDPGVSVPGTNGEPGFTPRISVPGVGPERVSEPVSERGLPLTTATGEGIGGTPPLTLGDESGLPSGPVTPPSLTLGDESTLPSGPVGGPTSDGPSGAAGSGFEPGGVTSPFDDFDTSGGTIDPLAPDPIRLTTGLFDLGNPVSLPLEPPVAVDPLAPSAPGGTPLLIEERAALSLPFGFNYLESPGPTGSSRPVSGNSPLNLPRSYVRTNAAFAAGTILAYPPQTQGLDLGLSEQSLSADALAQYDGTPVGAQLASFGAQVAGGHDLFTPPASSRWRGGSSLRGGLSLLPSNVDQISFQKAGTVPVSMPHAYLLASTFKSAIGVADYNDGGKPINGFVWQRPSKTECSFDWFNETGSSGDVPPGLYLNSGQPAAIQYTPPQTPVATAVSDSAPSNQLDAGTHSWVYTLLISGVESLPTAISNVLSTAGPGVQAAAIDAGGHSFSPFPAGTTQFNLYRTAAGNVAPFKLASTWAYSGGSFSGVIDVVADSARSSQTPPAASVAVPPDAQINGGEVVTVWSTTNGQAPAGSVFVADGTNTAPAGTWQNFSGRYFKSTTATVSAFSTVETILAQSPQIPANVPTTGSVFRAKVYADYGSNTTRTITFGLRYGAAGTTSDQSLGTLTVTSTGTTGGFDPFVLEVDLVVTGTGASGTGKWNAVILNGDPGGYSSGIVQQPTFVVPGGSLSATNLDTTAASYLSVTAFTSSTLAQIHGYPPSTVELIVA